MSESTVNLRQLGRTSRDLAQRLMIIGQNRLELLMVELQEERERLLLALLLALGVAAFGLLAGLSLTAAVVICFWASSPVAALLTLTFIYGATGVYLGRRLKLLLRDWQTLSASLDQLRKDRACLDSLCK